MPSASQIEQQLRAVATIVRGARDALELVMIPGWAPLLREEAERAEHGLNVAVLALENALMLRLPDARL